MNNYAARSFYFNFIKKNFKNIHVFSPNQYKVLKEQYPDKNILMAPLCLKDFGKPTSTHSRQNSKKNFLFFGILRDNKGIDLLIEAVKDLSIEYKNFTVTIAGKPDGDYWEKIKSEAENNPFFTLKIRTIANEEVADLLTTADFMVLPYRDATQSGVLLTSYNYGLPVIASDLAGFNEYVHDGVNGFLFDTGNLNSLIKMMRTAIEMPDNDYFILRKNLAEFIDHNINTVLISKKYIEYFNKLN
jgi:glycosyltransferase involved in cell wall biosynthesis